MSLPFGDLPVAKSLLDFQRVLSPTAGVRVSPLCLGAGNFGDAWSEAFGVCDKKTSFEILDYFYDQGGNFIDTANLYQDEQSETWIGEWMQKRGRRDEMVIATKFSSLYPAPKTRPRMAANFAGNSTKSLHLSLEASLKKLQTDYVDLLYIHWWDFTTGIPELMQSLNHMVQRGKVLYLGVSDTPAYIVSKANQYARDHGLRPFSVYQGRWSASERDFEREIIPMAREEGMALVPWGVLGSGSFTIKAKRENNERGRVALMPQLDRAAKVAEKLEAVAKRRDTLITSIALAYVRTKYPYVIPIVGGRKVEHLKGNIEALSIDLSAEEVLEIESAVEFDVGFPLSMIFALEGGVVSSNSTSADVTTLSWAGNLEAPQHQQPIKPHGLQGYGRNP
ncbi:NADP-dependent oxidoreductase domain-containing protein [Boeremia exigua]|uniref:NADP-dependent oxidoreductase domain-containing protein n=1 Tax=Boeremia exigua TaxID=749465 RepID=UPI001E8EB96F|nr:NADP-dependent oxidoreductase domain-containing protein [Boeremia exigua]KAH6614149.1 NADP-dependent oxidoreductase domain-containing protein [Boeremia exigua]